MVRWLVMLLACLSISCASNVERFSDLEDIARMDPNKLNTAADAEHHIVDYGEGKAKAKVEWFGCQLKSSPKGTVLVMNRDQVGFADDNFCRGWIAQSFLSEGWNVLAVNRPGYGESTGAMDLSGPESLKAIESAVADFRKRHTGQKISGVWGYSTGGIAAAFYAKKNQEILWLMMGGAVYDAEQTEKSSGDEWLKNQFSQLKAKDPNGAFEKRSIAWDFDGIPKTVLIYHGQSDVAIPSAQASSFRDSLMTQEYKVRFILLNGVGHDLPADVHAGVIKKLLAEQSKPDGK